MEPEEEDVPNELEFYSKFTRPLIFNLLDAKDRALASSWVKKIKDEGSGTLKLRTDYLKLLLFALQRGHLVGVFADDPANYETLEEFPAECDLNDIAKKLIEKDQGNRQEKIKQQLRGEIGDHPPYITDCSSDFREYVAAQDVPNFGVHCYYAVSKEPVNTWQRSERGVFPKLARSAVDTTSPLPPCPEGTTAGGGKSDILCVCPPEEGEEETPCKTRMDETLADGAEEKKKKRGKKWGQTPPTKPLGVIPPADERPPPTWGTNLLDVRESAVDLEEEEEDVGVGMVEDLSAVEQFIEDFRRGALGTSKRAESTALQKSIEAASAGTEGKAAGRGEEEEEQDEAAAQRAQELEEDSHLVEYFKGQLAQAMTRQAVSKDKEAARISTPAKAGVPVTTPKQSPMPKRSKPDNSDDSFNPDELDDSELADLGLTRDQAKELFRTDVFKMPLDEDFGGDDSGGDDTFDEELQRDAIDDELDAWCERIKELEKECEDDIRYLREQGIDVDAIDALDLSAVDDGAAAARPCGSPVCSSKSPSPQKQRSPPRARSPERRPKGKGLSMIKKPSTIIPAAAKAKSPQASKLRKPSELTLKIPSGSKLQPCSRPSKLQLPKAGRIPQPTRPCPAIQKGSPQAAAVITDYEKMTQLQIADEPTHDLPQAEGADLIEDQQMPDEFNELDFIPPSPIDQRFAELDQYSQLVDSLMDICEPCQAYESPPRSPGAPSPRTPDRYGLPSPISLPPLKTPSPLKPPRQQTPQRAPSPGRAASPSRAPASPRAASPRAASPRAVSPRAISPERYPSPLKPIQPSPHRRPSPPCGTLSPDIMEMAANMSPDRMSPCGVFEASSDFAASPEAYERTPPGLDIFAQISGEGLDTSPPCIVDHYTSPPQSPATPPMQRDMGQVGYSISTQQPQVAPLSPQYLDYKSPPKQVPKIDRKKSQQREEKFIQFLFGDDQDLHETLQRVASLVADIEQEEPDPYHLMPASPPPIPFDQLGDDDIFGETFPIDYESMSPPSPIRTQGGLLCPGTAHTGRTSTPVGSRLPLPGSGIPRPGFKTPIPRTPAGREIPSMTCNAPCPKGKPAPSSGAPPGTPIIRPGQTPPCWGTGIPGSTDRLPQNRRIPQPGMKRKIPQPQLGPPKSGIPQPGGRKPCAANCGQAAGRGAPRGTGMKPPGGGIRPPTAGRGRIQQPSIGPCYFPQQTIDMEPQYPPTNIGFRESVKKHKINDAFLDRQRPMQSSRCVVTGKTSGRRMVMQRTSDPRVRPPKPPMNLPLDFPKGMFSIKERGDEPPLSPVQYGVPGMQMPPRPTSAASVCAGTCLGKAAGGGRPSGIKPPSVSRIPPPSGMRPSRQTAATGIPSKLRPPSLRSSSTTQSGSPAEQANLFHLAEQIVGILGEYVEMKSNQDSRFEDLEQSLISGPPTPCGPAPGERSVAAAAGRQVGKGFKPGPGGKVQYPRQVPGTPPPPTPIPWWEVETPSPTFEPPPGPHSPPREYSGFLASPSAGPSCRPSASPQYSPPAYDSPGGGLMEEAPPYSPGYTPADLRIPGVKSPKKPVKCPSLGIGSTPSISRVPGAPIPKKGSRLSSNAGKRRLDFEALTPRETDDYIASLEERYGDSLPPLPPDQVPCGPCGPAIRVAEWKTPPEIERMVPKQRPPSPKPLPPVSIHPYFASTPLPTAPNCSVCVESPELADSPRTPTGLTPTPPRRSPSPRSPSSFDASPVFSPCMSPGPAATSRAQDIFSSAGMSRSPVRPPSPSPPSPAMHGMLANVKQATGRRGIERRRLRFDSPGINQLTPLPPIREMATRPGEGRLGLPGVVQVDYATLGTGGDEEECVCGPYVPPSRSPCDASLSGDEYEDDDYEQIYQDPGPMTEEEKRQLQGVAPTSPLRSFQPGGLTSPPRPSPPFALPDMAPMLDQTSMSFEEDDCFCADGSPAQVTPKPSPMLTPCQSPPRTPTSPFLPAVNPYDPMLSDQGEDLAASPVSPTQTDEYGLPCLVDLYESPTQQRQRRIISWDDQPYAADYGHAPVSSGPCAMRNRFQQPEIQLDAIPQHNVPVDMDLPIAPLDPYVERELSQFHYSPPFPQIERGAPDITMECDPCGLAQSPKSPSPTRTPPQMGHRWGHMMDESMHANMFGEQMSPFSSPQGSPGEGPIVTQTSSTKRFITGIPPPQ